MNIWWVVALVAVTNLVTWMLTAANYKLQLHELDELDQTLIEQAQAKAYEMGFADGITFEDKEDAREEYIESQAELAEAIKEWMSNPDETLRIYPARRPWGRD